MGRTREDREELIAKDDGDADDTVWVSDCHVTGSRRRYHRAPCRYADPETDREHTRGDAQARGFAPCRLCVLDDHGCDDNHNDIRLADRIREQVAAGEIDVETIGGEP